MFNNIGQKLKKLAKAYCGIGISVCIIGGIVLLSIDDDWELILAGILTAVFGSLFSYVISMFIYGFGQLIENSDILLQNSNKSIENGKTNNTANNTAKPPVKNPMITDEHFFKNYKIGNCGLCNNTNCATIKCEIEDTLGTRKFTLCHDCFNKYKSNIINIIN